MPDTTAADQSDAAQTGALLGHAVAGIVILHFRAMWAGDAAGYAAAREAARTGVAVPDLVHVPDEYAPAARAYRDAYDEGRALYRADHATPQA